jgi:DNA-directed RNA polymerase specialized sigma subunit
MGKQKLTETKVRRIKKLLLEGEMTKTAIGEMYGVTRSQICKINLGMYDPTHKNARWSEVKI